MIDKNKDDKGQQHQKKLLFVILKVLNVILKHS